jgi:hypothetical protein
MYIILYSLHIYFRIEAFPQIMLYDTFLAKLLPDPCHQSFAVQRYSRVRFRFSVQLQYHNGTAIHTFATPESYWKAKMEGKNQEVVSPKKCHTALSEGRPQFMKVNILKFQSGIRSSLTSLLPVTSLTELHLHPIYLQNLM